MIKPNIKGYHTNRGKVSPQSGAIYIRGYRNLIREYGYQPLKKVIAKEDQSYLRHIAYQSGLQWYERKYSYGY